MKYVDGCLKIARDRISTAASNLLEAHVADVDGGFFKELGGSDSDACGLLQERVNVVESRKCLREREDIDEGRKMVSGCKYVNMLSTDYLRNKIPNIASLSSKL